jgi:hypothetical protein
MVQGNQVIGNPGIPNSNKKKELPVFSDDIFLNHHKGVGFFACHLFYEYCKLLKPSWRFLKVL